MIKICSNGWCKASFEVTDDDLAFYDKVSPVFGDKKYAVPSPTLCPDCRMQSRMLWRNETHVFSGTSALSGKKIMTQFSPGSPYTVYSPEEWQSDAWNPLTYGMEVTPSSFFFDEFDAQLRKIPLASRSVIGNENCDYANSTSWCKNCYMVGASSNNEDCYYCYHLRKCRNCIDCSFIFNCERCYECMYCRDSFGLRFSQKSIDCSESYFLMSCRHCKNCFGCANLVQKQYCFFNEQLTAEEYAAEIAKLDLGSRAGIQALQERCISHWLRYPRKNMIGEMNDNVSGNNIFNSQNCRSCFNAYDLEQCARCWTFSQAKDCMDCFAWGSTAELCYECTEVGDGTTNTVFSAKIYNSHNILYSFACQASHHLFGCISMKNASYCIFNIQYSKDEYEQRVSEIIEGMMQRKEWGKFFPARIAPFAYNASAAIDYFPRTKNEALGMGAHWHDQSDTMETDAAPAPDTATEIGATSATYRCEITSTPFKIIEQELAFYRSEGLPPPAVCFPERTKRRFRTMDARQFWERPCMRCTQPMKTTYAPDRPEIVYCEECYLKEVY